MSIEKTLVVCEYTAKADKSAELEGLLATHWGTLHKLGLTTDPPARVLKGAKAESHDAGGKYLEIFSWKSENSMKLAHETPEVMAIWEGIGACCSALDFPTYHDIT